MWVYPISPSVAGKHWFLRRTVDGGNVVNITSTHPVRYDRQPHTFTVRIAAMLFQHKARDIKTCGGSPARTHTSVLYKQDKTINTIRLYGIQSCELNSHRCTMCDWNSLATHTNTSLNSITKYRMIYIIVDTRHVKYRNYFKMFWIFFIDTLFWIAHAHKHYKNSFLNITNIHRHQKNKPVFV